MVWSIRWVGIATNIVLELRANNKFGIAPKVELGYGAYQGLGCYLEPGSWPAHDTGAGLAALSLAAAPCPGPFFSILPYPHRHQSGDLT